MKKILILVVLASLLAVQSFAGTERQGDGALLSRDVPVQGFSPNGLYNSVTSTNATFHNLTNFLAYSFYCAADCKVRMLPTAAKGTYPAMTAIGGEWYTFVKNTATPFINISSSAGATHSWMQQ